MSAVVEGSGTATCCTNPDIPTLLFGDSVNDTNAFIVSYRASPMKLLVLVNTGEGRVVGPVKKKNLSPAPTALSRETRSHTEVSTSSAVNTSPPGKSGLIFAPADVVDVRVY